MSFRKKSRQESAPVDEQAEKMHDTAEAHQEQFLDCNVKPGGQQAPDQIMQIKGDAAANDLIRRVIKAIDDWARANGLNALPRHIIFEQALSILNAIDRNSPTSD
jgi:hypothetical protein